MNDSIVNYSIINNEYDFSKSETKYYFYLKYNKSKIEKNKTVSLDIFDDINFELVDFNNSSTLNYQISFILSLNSISYSLIIIDYINSQFILDNDSISENEDFLIPENICYNNISDYNNNKKFMCKLDYLLFGHEDLKKDDVYLAKEIREENSIAYLDNFLSYNIFPEEYLQYFLTSFFSELNDECQKNEYTYEDYGNTFYYITCPKQKIEIYTKRRKLSVIINKISYLISDLFKDSLEFLKKIDNDNNYYFNIVFEKGRKNFILGIGFFKNKKIGYYDNCTYIYAKDRNNYTEDLTDINSEQFEKWLYILTTFSFTFLLLIFTIIGCMNKRKINKELREMLK